VKYVLIDRGDNVVDKIDLSGELSDAKEFFLKRKKIEIKEFNNLWKVMTEEQYDTQRDLSNRQNKQYEWWREDKAIVDEELKI
jgi:hypothetical protein|tara:strand:- start:478 stop:726 length:249 start_codon:yes stop_codon:yes gene_type:complete